jgi:hypothetical protein
MKPFSSVASLALADFARRGRVGLMIALCVTFLTTGLPDTQRLARGILIAAN